ncbi:hypothetical protein, partial [Burkholderia cepacia]|uniref:hypothetical protein n=1 Tax=Burkholderia cepacia TaxID=292 RepID=UPI001CF19B4A
MQRMIAVATAARRCADTGITRGVVRSRTSPAYCRAGNLACDACVRRKNAYAPRDAAIAPYSPDALRWPVLRRSMLYRYRSAFRFRAFDKQLRDR